MIEVEPVHLGAHDVIIYLCGRRPTGSIQCSEAPLVRGELAMLRRHRARRVVGHAVDELRLLERAPGGEQAHLVFMARGTADLLAPRRA
jgi:hypothetical protein